MPTKYCTQCGYQIYDNQEWRYNSADMICHYSWEDCSYSIDKGDALERDGIRRWQAMRRRSAGLHFQ